MDKLKQVQKYQFWILLVVALILPIVGWTMATGSLATEADTNTKALETLYGSLSVGPTDPNRDWEKGGNEINAIQALQPKRAHAELYNRQLELMVWPSEMPTDPALIQRKHQEYYRTTYRRGSSKEAPLLDEVRKIVKPYDEDTGTGLLVYDPALLPTADLEWVSQAPSIEQIKAAQEDLWLLASLLKQIAWVNEEAGAKNQFDAPIRQITELYLKGGSQGKAGGGAKTGCGGGGGGGGGGVGGGGAA